MNWNDERYQRERYADMLRDLERERIIDALRAAQPSRPRLHRAALARIGGLLVSIGSRLQRRYGAIAEVTISVKAGDNLPQC